MRLDDLPMDDERGTMGMWLAITNEALLFVSLFFAYYYVGHNHVRWPAEPPKLPLAFILLAVLVSSSIVLHLGEHMLKKGDQALARTLLGGTIALGVVFLVIQGFEYRNHLRELKPTTNAYGSIFYVITSIHALHVVVGLIMLLFVAFLPSFRPRRSPHRPLHNVSLYWHFVDVVWLFIVGLLYVVPHWTRF